MHEASLLFRLSAHSEQSGNQCNLATHISFVHSLQLSFSHHVHDLISLYRSPPCLKGEETHIWFCQTLDETVILFNEVIEILHLPQFTAFRNESCCFEFVEGFGVGGVFVHVDHTRRSGMRGGEGFLKEALGSLPISGRTQHEVERVPL